MHGDSTHPPFLGPCEVCGKTSHNYKAMSQHLRFKEDVEHRNLHARWVAWRSEYRATLRCRKCGDLFGITDKGLKDTKRCSRCEHLRQTLSKKKYESLSFDKAPDPRTHSKCGNSKSRWPVGYKPVVESDSVRPQAEQVLASGGGVRAIMDLGVPYGKARALIVRILGGEVEYRRWVLARKAEVAHANREQARTSSGLEDLFVVQMQGNGIDVCGRNEWMTLTVGGSEVHREMDIKIRVDDTRKAIVLCDGEVFHGPGCLYNDPVEKIADDRATALAMFQMGYTVLRYSEGEIKDGSALGHLMGVLSDLRTHHHVYRNWHPQETTYGGKGGVP